jgi:hypothetical protein
VYSSSHHFSYYRSSQTNLNDVDFLSRVTVRQHIIEEKFSRLKELILIERRKNLEMVLAAVFRLVNNDKFYGGIHSFFFFF